MRVRAGDVSLWFEVLGTKQVFDGGAMRERPTVVTLHGGPGVDSANDVVAQQALSEIAQVVVYDQRGHGRSDASTPERWNLDQWADDLVAFCEALDIRRPIVLGGSFGGFVAQRYATRHPDHPAALVLLVTTPRLDDKLSLERFRELGGEVAADVFRRDSEESTLETAQEFLDVCLPLMSTRPGVEEYLAERMARTTRTDEVAVHFTNGEGHTFDLRPELAKLACPTLLVTGERDPVTPPVLAREIVDAAPEGLVEYTELAGAGHMLGRDAGPQLEKLVREFVLRVWEAETSG